MGLWNGIKNVVTLGGAYRLDRAKERYAVCHEAYQRIIARLTSVNAEIEAATSRLKIAFQATKSRLSFAESILHPPCLAKRGNQSVITEAAHYGAGSISGSLARRELGPRSSGLAVAGAFAGTSAALVAWQGVQLLGIASTGTAIGGIYGAAASNAGWAAFGGGSLASGGGGMAAGHLVLPGLGAVVAVGFAAYSTHSKANELNRYSDELEEAQEKNRAVLDHTRREADKLLRAESVFLRADQSLANAEKLARSKLRRFGWLSVFYRYIRFKIKGVYYTLDELHYMRNLERAVQTFMSTFGAGESQG